MLDRFKAKKAVESILFAADETSPEVKEAASKLRGIGAGAVPHLIDALQYNRNSAVLESLLSALLDHQTESRYIKALGNKDPYILSGVARVLARSQRINPSHLMHLLKRPDVSKNALIHVLRAHPGQLDMKALLELIPEIDPDYRRAYFKLIEETARESILSRVPALVADQDPEVRHLAARLLRKFDKPESVQQLLNLLDDPHRTVRYAALDGLANTRQDVSAKRIIPLLRDPDMTVQAKAIETLNQLDAPDTVLLLIDILQDPSEYVRRAAVEVLNEIGNEHAIKDLLSALRDKDWWVKVRAADALGHIGGPKVMDAIFRLIKDEDEFLRRTAVEILNQTQDERAFDYLVEALDDSDWWVRERAADALANIGDKRATAPLVKMLDEHGDAAQIAIRALGTLNDPRAIKPIIKHLSNADEGVRKEALQALAAITDDAHSPLVQTAIAKATRVEHGELKNLADEAVNILVKQYGDQADQEALDQATALMDASEADDQTMIDLAGGGERDSTPSQQISLEPGTLLDDRYRVIKRIGEGAFGIVMLVEDVVVNEQIILKFLNPKVASDESVVRRFVHELRYARKITHENVIRIYDFLTFDKNYAISMEYFASHSLGTEIRSGRSKDIKRSLRLLHDLLVGLEFAHRANVVHRDLKPANILIDDDDQVKIVDFGLAAAATSSDSRVTKSGILVGTPTYMAPEQARGQAIDQRTDIYSLGVMMYEMFTGKPPYTGSDSMAILFKHVEGNPKPPRALNPDLPEELQDVILKAMSVKREDRYQSVEELAAALDTLTAKV